MEFRDTPLGRVAYVQGTRVQVAFVYDQVRRDPTRTSEAIAAAFAWPRWKAAGGRAYLEAFPDECRTEWEDLESAGFQVLKRALPQLEQKDSAAP